jgi:hypothetical protein
MLAAPIYSAANAVPTINAWLATPRAQLRLSEARPTPRRLDVQFKEFFTAKRNTPRKRWTTAVALVSVQF